MTDSSNQAAGYQSLYRRFRPQRFSEVLGQDHVALALRNAVRDGRIGHAYLFSGPRGTGKTSTARILGKALNCTALVDGEPCGECDSCKSVVTGTSFDVHELDAASNNGVDAMRDLVARTALATPGRWKVYIVDEVHMLSTAASNALLKTLEEPPDHVVFVLATTESQKVLPTIRSRTQHFEFHLLSDDTLAGLLDAVAGAADLDLPDGALTQAVRRARGSARDALSMLDQVAVSGVSGVDEEAWCSGVIGAISDYDASRTLLEIEHAIRSGRDPQQLAIDLIDRLRLGFLSLVSRGALDADRGLAAGDLAEMQTLGTVRVVRAMETIGLALVAMRDAPDPRITLEVALLRLTRPEDETSTDALFERLERLERRIEQLTTAPSLPLAPSAVPAPPPSRADAAAPASPPRAASSGTDPAPAPASPAKDASGDAAKTGGPTAARPALGAFLGRNEVHDVAPAPEAPTRTGQEPTTPSVKTPPSVPETAVEAPSRDLIVAAWGDRVLTGLRAKVRAIYQAGRFVDVVDGEALFALPNQAHLSHAEPLRQEVDAALSEHFKTPIRIRLITEDTAKRPGSTATNAPSGDEAAVPPADESADEFADIDFAETTEALEPVDGASLAEDRLLKAFPGAEEI